MGLQVRTALLGAALASLLLPVVVEQTAATAHSTLGGGPPVGVVQLVTVSSARPAEAPACRAGLVALTFDDGPARGLTVRLVQTLERLHVPATFFMVGSRVSTAPHAAQVVARAGFAVGNHTWSHAFLTRLSDPAVRSEIRRTASILHRLGVPETTLMRPPYGDIDPRVRADVEALGLVPVLWDVDSHDWRGGSPSQIASSILAQLRPHQSNIVLQHDGVRNSPASVAAVPQVVHSARQRGYCFTHLGREGRMAPLAAPGTAGVDPGSAASASLRTQPSFGMAHLATRPVSGA